jgi:carboxymethylenebutenolidase
MEITSGMVQIAWQSGSLPAFLARPAGGGKHPAVVLVMEAFGLNAHIKDVAGRLAREGYVTLAPDMYHREKNAVVGYDNLQEAIRLMMNLSDDQITEDMGAALTYLQQQPFVRADRLGVTGFCMGGRITFLTACMNAAVKAAAPFYGGGIGGLLQHAERLSAPMLLFFGGDDAFIPPDEVEKIKHRLAELKKNAEVIIYPGAPHGFFCNERDSYRADAAKDAWVRLLKFFEKHLKS